MFNVKNLVIGIGIVVLFALVLWQGIETFYPSPDYDNYCGDVKTQEIIETGARCESIGGKWEPNDEIRCIKEPCPQGWCDRDYTCRKDYDKARDNHSWVVFIISLIVGIIAFVLGFTLLKLEPVGSSLIASGVWAVFWGSAINWRNFGESWRFILLLIALVLLVWFAIRLNKK